MIITYSELMPRANAEASRLYKHWKGTPDEKTFQECQKIAYQREWHWNTIVDELPESEVIRRFRDDDVQSSFYDSLLRKEMGGFRTGD